ncbi:MAG: prepilin-type N-terminal cleavage/methylation domain-containing protein [Thermoleophilia bacterium]|nr:prepilin-type N-terminal cleavage/methylation domain-containing protein [Thermoleophilia bacterium]
MRQQSGFTLIELLVVVLVAGITAAAVLGLYLGVFRSSADQTVRIQNQDSARTAMYEMSRLVRAACSSDSNLTSVSDSLVLANPQEFIFFVDLDSDGSAERVRYYLSDNTLRMQTAEPNTGIPVTYPTGYSIDSLVILDGMRNGADPVFTYYGYDEDDGALYEIPIPNTEPLRREVVAIGIQLIVNEKPEIARGGVELSTRVLIRQRYDGGLSGT